MFQETTATKKIIALNKRIRAIQGGTSASKTISNLLYLIAMAQGDKKPTLTSVVAESIPHLKRGALRDFKNIMTAHGYWRESRWAAGDRIYTFETGSQLEFFSADDATKLRGGRRDRLFMNECNNMTLESFNELEVRTKEFVILDWNPTNEFWFYTEILNKRDDVDYVILTYKDNEALDKQIIEAIEARRANKNWFKVYGEGQLGEVEGRIYTGWNLIDEIPHEARLERYGLDFGFTNDPSSLVAVYHYNGGIIFDEIMYKKGLLNSQIADILKNIPQAPVIADSAEPKSIEEIRQYGIAIIPCEKGRDSVRQGINFLQQQKVSVTKQSTNIIREYRNYMWLTDKNGKTINEPDHLYSHSMDACRYAVANQREHENVLGNVNLYGASYR